MANLPSSSDPSKWLGYLEQYSNAIQERNKPGLGALDEWLFDTLPTTIAARDPPHCTAAELVDIVRWKLSRGKWRPSLLGYAKAHSESTVASSSTAALRALGPSPAPLERVTAALNHLTTLKGVGVATASAVLAAVDPSVPFMSDEAIAAALPGDKRYTLSVYVHVLKWLRARAAALQQHAADDGVVWRVREVERALWTEAALTRGGPATQKQKAAPGGSAPPARRSSAKRRKM